MIKGIIFDMDGVIADTMQLHYDAWKEFLKRHSKDTDSEEFKHNFGKINFEIFKAIFPDDEDNYMKYDEEKESIYRDMAKTKLRAMPGAVDLIKYLHAAKYPLVIGSSGNPTNIEFNLKKLSLSKYFEGFVSSYDVENGKPDPEVFLKAAQIINVKPSECLVIEDSYHGIEAAHAADMKAVAVSSTHDPSKLMDAELVVDSLSSLNVEEIKRLE